MSNNIQNSGRMTQSSYYVQPTDEELKRLQQSQKERGKNPKYVTVRRQVNPNATGRVSQYSPAQTHLSGALQPLMSQQKLDSIIGINSEKIRFATEESKPQKTSYSPQKINNNIQNYQQNNIYLSGGNSNITKKQQQYQQMKQNSQQNSGINGSKNNRSSTNFRISNRRYSNNSKSSSQLLFKGMFENGSNQQNSDKNNNNSLTKQNRKTVDNILTQNIDNNSSKLTTEQIVAKNQQLQQQKQDQQQQLQLQQQQQEQYDLQQQQQQQEFNEQIYQQQQQQLQKQQQEQTNYEFEHRPVSQMKTDNKKECPTQKEYQNEQFGKLLDKNQMYLKHLQGDCLCGRCLCGKCRCPKMIFSFGQDKKQPSSYQRDYIKQRDVDQELPQITMEFHNSYQTKLPMELTTTQKDDYVQKQQQNTKPIYGRGQLNRDFPFSASSSYDLNFINWGTYKATNLAPKIGTTIVPNLNLGSKTMYKENFNKGNDIPKIDENTEFIKKWQKRPNFKNPDFPFQPHTTHKQTYRPFKQTNIVERPKKEEFHSMPAYEGQFKSSQQKQFDMTQNIECPSRKELSEYYKQQVMENEKDALAYQSQLKREITSNSNSKQQKLA